MMGEMCSHRNYNIVALPTTHLFGLWVKLFQDGQVFFQGLGHFILFLLLSLATSFGNGCVDCSAHRGRAPFFFVTFEGAHQVWLGTGFGFIAVAARVVLRALLVTRRLVAEAFERTPPATPPAQHSS